MESGELQKDNILVEKSFKFAIRIVDLYKYLSQNKKEFILSKQVLRSGTSIGANISESQDAQSKADFISKLSIALKEAKETKYWIELLRETDFLNTTEASNILEDVIEIIKLLISIIKTTKQNKDRNEK